MGFSVCSAIGTFGDCPTTLTHPATITYLLSLPLTLPPSSAAVCNRPEHGEVTHILSNQKKSDAVASKPSQNKRQRSSMLCSMRR
jgi:hypothetical protein